MDKDILEIERGPREKAAVGEEVDRVADGLSVDLRHQDADPAAHIVDQSPCRRGTEGLEFLVACQRADQCDQGLRVALLVRPDSHSVILKRSDDWRNSSATRSPNFFLRSWRAIFVNGSTWSGRPWTPIHSLSKRGPSGT